MSHSRQTIRNISDAMRSIDSSVVPEDCATEVYYDKVGRCWYAQFLSHTSQQVGYLGRGFSPLAAVQELMELNPPGKSRKVGKPGESSKPSKPSKPSKVGDPWEQMSLFSDGDEW